MKKKTRKPTKPGAKRALVPRIKKGKYSDGHPLDDLHYLECKLILNGDRFTSVDSFYEFTKLVKRAAATADVGFSRKGFKELRPAIREVLFLDTSDFRLYNNAFILRRRQNYMDGFAVGDPEIVFKFRHPDLQKTAELDLRPRIAGDFRIKFKAEALPLKDKIGGYRILFSHNAQFPLSAIRDDDPMAMASLVRMLPPLQTLKLSSEERIELVNQTAVEEVLLDIGMLDFGKGVQAKSNVAVWRTRGDQKQLVGEFAFQARMERQSELHAVAKLRCEQFFIALQHIAEQWLALGTTKTGAVYRLKGNAPQAHE